MNAPMRSVSLLEFQRRQKEHDVKSHWDIVCLSSQDRLKHLVLHFSKYVGRLAGNIDNKSTAVTIADTFIISLATANVLNLNLSAKCGSGRVNTEMSPVEIHKRFWIGLAIATGHMAKACEALDHVERFNSREQLEIAVIEICNLCLDAAASMGIVLDEAVLARWNEIDAKRTL
ncbi:MAG TPA: hypothetical protein VGK77_28455 [Candidatus Binatia bacterium]|jgi:hypothetical protein